MSRIKIGLTGGIGSGKSTVARTIEEAGYPVFYADDEAKKIQIEDSKVRKAIKELLGDAAYEGNVINRTYVANRVFNDNALLQALNGIVHPAVLRCFRNWVEAQTKEMVFLESAILIETGWNQYVDYVVNVVAPIEERITRVLTRDNCTKEQIQARINHQLSDDLRNKKSDYILENKNGDSVVDRVNQLLTYLRGKQLI